MAGRITSPLGWPLASATHQAIQPCQENAATASQVVQVALTVQEKVMVPLGTQVPVRGGPSPNLSATTPATPAPTPPGQAGLLKLCPCDSCLTQLTFVTFSANGGSVGKKSLTWTGFKGAGSNRHVSPGGRLPAAEGLLVWGPAY